VCPFSLSRSRPQVIDRQEPKLPRRPFLLLWAPQRCRPPLATNRCPLRLPELHFGFTMLLDVRVDAIRLRSRPLMSSYSVELSWAPQRRSVASDPELVRRHLSELTTGSTPPYEPTNAADDLWSDLPPSSPFPLSFSTTNSLAGEPPTSLTPPIRAPTLVLLPPLFSHHLTAEPCRNRLGRCQRTMGERIPCFVVGQKAG
jgi:hypothetical protein